MQIRLVNVGMNFTSGGGRNIEALRGVSFEIQAREFVSVVGPSGCGKSTLLRIIAGLLSPTSGHVDLDVGGTADRPMSALVFQDHGLLPWYTVLENIALGLELAGIHRTERTRRAREFINQMGLEQFAASWPHELSIGMQQRVGIARAFVTDPETLLLDEPFGSLDAQIRVLLREELLRIWRDHRKLVIHVTHDIDEAIMLSDRVLVLSGRPGTVILDLPVPLPRPRTMTDLEQATAVGIRRQIWEVLETEVRRGLTL